MPNPTKIPQFTRRSLRQRLGQDFLHDTIVGTTTGSHGATGSMTIWDSKQADVTASGESLYFRSYLSFMGANQYIQDVRVSSFNTGSGAFIALVTAATTIISGANYEVSTLLSRADKDRALDSVIKNVRLKQELPIWAINNGHIYSLGPDVLDVIDVKYFSDPTDSLNYGEHKIDWWKFEQTGSGQQLRINPSLPASYQLIVDAIISVSLSNQYDDDLVNLYSDDQVLWAAAARCFWYLEQQSPAKEAAIYKTRRAECAKEATRLARRFQPKISRKIQLDLPY